jgi:hypothetical protein
LVNIQDLVYHLLCGGADAMRRPGEKESFKSAYQLATEEKDEEILSLLNKTNGFTFFALFYSLDLAAWLGSIDMKKYLCNFIKEMIFKDILSVITDSTLNDMGVKFTGDRLRIIQAVEQFKREEGVHKGKTPKTEEPEEKENGKIRLSTLRRKNLLGSNSTTVAR